MNAKVLISLLQGIGQDQDVVVVDVKNKTTLEIIRVIGFEEGQVIQVKPLED